MYTPECFAFQGPEYLFGINVLTSTAIIAAHACNTEVHVWTIDSDTEMRRFIEKGVDGIITDHPDKLMKILAN